jgi:hypothetical protein
MPPHDLDFLAHEARTAAREHHSEALAFSLEHLISFSQALQEQVTQLTEQQTESTHDKHQLQ